MDRFDSVPSLEYAMANDDEHHGFRLDGLFSERKDGKTVIARGCRHKLECCRGCMPRASRRQGRS